MKKKSLEAKSKPVMSLVSSRSYRKWIIDLRKRYKAAQVKAAVSVNTAMLEFYWGLGKDISEQYAATQYYGNRFFECVSKDLTDSFRNPQGLSVVNIRYCQRFYGLYSSLQNLPQLVEELVNVPWGQHRCIIDSCKGDAQKALFYMTCVDRQVKHEWDGPTVGLVLCKSRDKMVVEYALSGSDRPIGVAQYKLHKVMPKELRIAAESIARLSAVVDETISSVKEGEGK